MEEHDELARAANMRMCLCLGQAELLLLVSLLVGWRLRETSRGDSSSSSWMLVDTRRYSGSAGQRPRQPQKLASHFVSQMREREKLFLSLAIGALVRHPEEKGAPFAHANQWHAYNLERSTSAACFDSGQYLCSLKTGRCRSASNRHAM